jgi:metal-responsive CopG/Arc/MetJ family transcriptional regulator
MQSQLTVRLPENINKEISTIAKRLQLKRSDIVRIALEKFLGEVRDKEETKPYDKVRTLIGKLSSGISNLGEAHREYIINKFKKNA